MSVESVRNTAKNILDGMTFNRDKLARDCLSLCDANDRLTVALANERAKTAALEAKLASRPGTSSSQGAGTGMPNDFAEAFGNMFGTKENPFKPSGKRN